MDLNPVPEHSTPDFEAAAEHLDAEIVARPGTPATKAVRTLANLAVGLFTGDSDSAMSTTDLVVTRRDTGGEILRTAAGSIVEADQLLQRVRLGLEKKTVTEFIAEWRLLDGPGESPA